jgi:excisionase family DNA binding protein
MTEHPLVSIGEASRVLGVSEATLRAWTDEGRIKAFVTPGGHRRYSRTDLKRFAGLQAKVHSIKDLTAEMEQAAAVQREIAQTAFPASILHEKLSLEERHRLAAHGRQMLNVIIKYITEPSRQEETIKLGQEVGRNFGMELAALGVPLTDALEAFLLHRTPFVNAVTNLLKRREMLSERAVEAVPLVSRVMDEALLSLVAVYQEMVSRSREA